MSERTKTGYYPEFFDKDAMKSLYKKLKKNIDWVDGVRSKNGFTRKAKAMQIGQNEDIDELILYACNQLAKDGYKFATLGYYLNYYRDGDDYTPNHTHKDTIQFVISLGATRTLTLGKKEYKMNSGDMIIFGSSIHGVPKEPEIKRGRISIATFCKKL